MLSCGEVSPLAERFYIDRAFSMHRQKFLFVKAFKLMPNSKNMPSVIGPARYSNDTKRGKSAILNIRVAKSEKF